MRGLVCDYCKVQLPANCPEDEGYGCPSWEDYKEREQEKMQEKFKRLLKWRNDFAAMEIEYGAKSFLEKPEKWFKDLHWFCENGHVCSYILTCEADGDTCLECHKPVIMGPPVGETEFVEKYMRYINAS